MAYLVLVTVLILNEFIDRAADVAAAFAGSQWQTEHEQNKFVQLATKVELRNTQNKMQPLSPQNHAPYHKPCWGKVVDDTWHECSQSDWGTVGQWFGTGQGDNWSKASGATREIIGTVIVDSSSQSLVADLMTTLS
jgi:hypothetical protein